MKISIQGNQGSFHHIVAETLYGKDIELLERDSFEEVFADTKDSSSDLGIVAIENTIAGSILSNYDLLLNNDLNIVGECFIRIEHSLIALPGTKLKDIKLIKGHQMAIKQCRAFLDKLDIKVEEAVDGAGFASEIKGNSLTNTGAIAHKIAADINNLEAIEVGIETNKQNFTRFFVISKNKFNGEANKTSITFETKNEPGSFAKAINAFAIYNVNLTKVVSRPVIGKPWEYQFYVDYEIDTNSDKGKALILALEENTSNLRTLGSYKKWEGK